MSNLETPATLDTQSIDPPGFEADAGLIAENVLLAVERMCGGDTFAPQERARAVTALMRALLAVMPASSGRVLREACNDALARLPGLELTLPRVEAVAVTDGSVTLRVS